MRRYVERHYAGCRGAKCIGSYFFFSNLLMFLKLKQILKIIFYNLINPKKGFSNINDARIICYNFGEKFKNNWLDILSNHFY